MNSANRQKKLTPSTIIPLDVYVERNADRQLASNVREMGRPAYVLVARQMGKTNLLIHAKRTLEDVRVRFVYVDLSVASYHDERECFRQIIDTAIDSHPDIFEDLEPEIARLRKLLKPANREHDQELRLLLSSRDVKLIIILDEIDSLVNAEFSDRVFAHIRSVYFSRINYPVLERLGYVLSGVVEPNEIIKDKKISPFNIGEKIYLNDFSRSEIEGFVIRAGLKLDSESLERLIYWTGGNPRILWDICSDLEDENSGEIITFDAIDRIVVKFYLTDFDRAPVDHIRELVRENSDVRSAVWSLVDKNPEAISDAARTKLYLFGIIKAVSSMEPPEIKNEIIARALSLEWLKGTALDRRSLLREAQDLFDKHRYDRALQGFRDYLEAAFEDDGILNIVNYQAGICAYYLGDFNNALGYFAEAKDLPSREVESRRDMLIGVCNFYLGSIDESILQFRQNLERGVSIPRLSCQIQMNLGGALLRRGGEIDLNEAELVFGELLSSLALLSNQGSELPTRKSLETATYYNLSNLYLEKGDREKAVGALRDAIGVAEDHALPSINLRLYYSVAVDEERTNYLREAVESCMSNKIYPVEYSHDKPLALSPSQAAELLGLISVGDLEHLFNEFLEYLVGGTPHRGGTPFAWLYEAGQNAITRRKNDQAIQVFRRALEDQRASKEDRLECLGWLVLIDPGNRFEEEYLTLLGDENAAPKFSVVHMHNVVLMAKTCVGSSNWKGALEVVRKASRFRDEVGPGLVRNYVGLDLIEMMCLTHLGDGSDVATIAVRTLDLLKVSRSLVNERNQMFFTDTDLDTARIYAIRYSKGKGMGVSIRRNLAISFDMGRNDKVSVRYTDGRELHGVKFKKVESDLLQGQCSLI